MTDFTALESSNRYNAGQDGERFVLLVTEGLVVVYPPEVYANHDRAEAEGERWAWVLATRERTAIERPFDGRWEVGDLWIRLEPAFLHEEGSEIWVGTFWTKHGYPDPEAALFSNPEQAREWAVAPLAGQDPSEVHATPWSVTATFQVGTDEEFASVNRAKRVS